MQKPPSVKLATTLLIAALLLGPIVLMLDFDYMKATMAAAGTGGMAGAMVVSIVIVGLLIWKIGQGRNWARIVFLVLIVLGSYSSYNTIMHAFDRGQLLVGLLQAVQALLQVGAMVLLFTPPGSLYFRKAEPVEPATPA